MHKRSDYNDYDIYRNDTKKALQLKFEAQKHVGP
jgi:hypothetical protein